MTNGSTTGTRSRCLNCGFEAPGDANKWGAVDAPPFGTLTQCPECNSTDIVSGQ